MQVESNDCQQHSEVVIRKVANCTKCLFEKIGEKRYPLKTLNNKHPQNISIFPGICPNCFSAIMITCQIYQNGGWTTLKEWMQETPPTPHYPDNEDYKGGGKNVANTSDNDKKTNNGNQEI
ncbi:unnamed protein product [Ceutorhynchus assimilis]|uniref:Uncharacterized protein n=1 Tax=Ceutorhynchus assimilis TaxID=467358 RepID=A0A9N9QL93_9CUCU|nr:unnamed protein product [Ceutorhynchus assimilis]